jgi:hypothetical protein
LHVGGAVCCRTSFAQKGGKGKGNGGGNGSDEYDKTYWKDLTCYNCDKKGHPSYACTAPKKKGKPKQDDDDKSRSSKASKADIAKLKSSIKKTFATLSTKIDKLEDEGLTNLEGEGNEQSAFQFAQSFVKKNEAMVLKQHTKSIELDLQNVILLDSQSTMDLFCNPKLVQDITKAKHKMTVQSNGGKLSVSHQAKVDGYDKKVWFSEKAITNIVALSNVSKQYRVTYDSDDKAFVVHREDQGKPNMEFWMHKSGLHVYDPKETNLSFVHTVIGNKEHYSQRQIKGAELARVLHATLGYPSVKDFK